VFPKTIIPCKGQRFKDVPEIEAEIQAILGKRDFQEMFAAGFRENKYSESYTLHRDVHKFVPLFFTIYPPIRMKLVQFI